MGFFVPLHSNMKQIEVVAAIIRKGNQKEMIMTIGDKAPEILGKDEQGRDIRLSDYKGRKLVLAACATTTANCRVGAMRWLV